MKRIPRIIAAAALTCLITACGGSGGSGGSNSGPTAPTPETGASNNPPPSNSIGVLLHITADGPFTATFAGSTITSAGTYSFVGLQPGTVQISGQISTSSLGIAFSRHAATVEGGIQQGSIQALDGPQPNAQPCSISYSNFATGAGAAPPTKTFSVQFTVTGSPNGTCP